MKALVMEAKEKLSLRDIEINEELGSHDVRIAIKSVGICGSDVHYYKYGAIGPFVVREPMVLGHEAAGVVEEIGENVTNLSVGDRVCMEPGIPNPNNKATQLGIYNVDPDVKFWATPPFHGILRTSVVHPAAFTYKLPDNVSMNEGALVEPLAIGMHAAMKAQIKPGDVAVVIGAGTIGMMTILAALAGGCSKVIVTDVLQPKLDITEKFGSVVTVNVSTESLKDAVNEATDGWGADIVFEASGSKAAAEGLFDNVAPGGTVVYIGMPAEGIVPIDIVSAQIKEIKIFTIFRYAHVYPRAVALISSGSINIRQLISKTFSFDDSVAAFEYASNPDPETVKTVIEISKEG